MASRFVKVPVAPSILTWARESLGMDIQEISKRLKVSKHSVSEWESGQKSPTLIQLQKLATIYKRPLAAFFLPKPPKESPLPNDFRTLSGEERKPVSSQTRLAIRRARRIDSLVAELSVSLNRDIKVQVARANLSDDPEVLAARIREDLRVGIMDQLGWKDEAEALKEWIRSLENLGVLVFQMKMPLNEARGFSLTDGTFPIIVLNSMDSRTAKAFTLFHEYAHVVTNEGGICDLEDIHNLGDEARLLERFCNHFAGAVLIPQDSLLNHDLVRSVGHLPEWPNNILSKLAKDFKVSQEVVLRRLLILGRTEEYFYRQKREDWKSELAEIRRKRKGGWQDPSRECLRENGVPFVSLVLDTFREEKITYSDVADYLSIRVKHLSKVEQFVRGMI
ncbi:ImmA/IrrE family metallo-endopeptidase [bacterium]|nr:ImmA/IrrE family metallo-endopeptidase [bacterium]